MNFESTAPQELLNSFRLRTFNFRHIAEEVAVNAADQSDDIFIRHKPDNNLRDTPEFISHPPPPGSVRSLKRLFS